jgi:hypothetical protein
VHEHIDRGSPLLHCHCPYAQLLDDNDSRTTTVTKRLSMESSIIARTRRAQLMPYNGDDILAATIPNVLCPTWSRVSGIIPGLVLRPEKRASLYCCRITTNARQKGCAAEAMLIVPSYLRWLCSGKQLFAA